MLPQHLSTANGTLGAVPARATLATLPPLQHQLHNPQLLSHPALRSGLRSRLHASHPWLPLSSVQMGRAAAYQPPQCNSCAFPYADLHTATPGRKNPPRTRNWNRNQAMISSTNDAWSLGARSANSPLRLTRYRNRRWSTYAFAATTLFLPPLRQRGMGSENATNWATQTERSFLAVKYSLH